MQKIAYHMYHDFAQWSSSTSIHNRFFISEDSDSLKSYLFLSTWYSPSPDGKQRLQVYLTVGRSDPTISWASNHFTLTRITKSAIISELHKNMLCMGIELILPALFSMARCPLNKMNGTKCRLTRDWFNENSNLSKLNVEYTYPVIYLVP